MAIFGGTFDPIHIGHMLLLERVTECVALDHILVMPCGIAPYGKQPMFDPNERMRMVSAAIDAYERHFDPKWVANPYEILEEGHSYTSETIQHVTDLSGEKPMLILGDEELWHIEGWHEPEKVLATSDVIAVDNGRSLWSIDELPEWITSKIAMRVEMAPMMPTLSSTVVRDKIEDGTSIRFLVPDVVHDIIREILSDE